jgi:glycosyltransferase involved in cell wall biosynthesis
MKIAMLTVWFPPIIVGSGSRFYEVGKRLAKKHEIHVYTTGIKGCSTEEEMDGMYIHRYGMLNASESKSMERHYHLFKLKFCFDVLSKRNLNKNFDIMDCNVVSKALSSVSYFVSRSPPTPLVLTWHEVWHRQNFKVLNPVMAVPGFILEFLLPQLPDLNIAVSETAMKRLVNLLHVQPEKIKVIPNGVDLKRFDEISVEKKYGRILYVGRLEKHKRVDNLILSYKQLKRRYKDLELIVVGTGPEEERLRKMARNVEDVTFYAPMPYEELAALMKSAWLFVLPSVREGHGIVLLEAMAAGTPPIAVKMPGSGVVDVIKDSYNGLLVSREGIKGGIEKLLIDDNLYEEIRKNGLEFVEGYDWGIIAKRTEEVYEQAKRVL